MSEQDTQAALREMSHSIGGLQATVNNLVQTWQAQEISATQGRRDLHAKMDSLRGELHAMAGKLAGALEDVAEMKPIVDALETAKAEFRGASRLGRWLWLAAGFVISALAWISTHWVSIVLKVKQ